MNSSDWLYFALVFEEENMPHASVPLMLALWLFTYQLWQLFERIIKNLCRVNMENTAPYWNRTRTKT